MNNCELCKLTEGNIITKLYYQDDKIIIVSCKTCGIPLLTLKRHDMFLTQEELEHILKVVKEQFPNYKLRMNQRQIKNHWHIHLIK